MRVAMSACLLLPALVVAQEPAPPAEPARPVPAAPAVDIDFAKPVRVLTLPPKLLEISALTALDDSRAACLQDEKGRLFELDLGTGALLGSRTFGPDGDYEGLARSASHWFALRSDGVVLRFPLEPAAPSRTEAFALVLAERDCEALALDHGGNALLVAPKERPDGNKEQRDLRRVYAWDLVEGALAPEPALTLSVSRLLEQAVGRGLATPTRKVKGGKKHGSDAAPPVPVEVPHLQLAISELAVHPRTSDLWILSSADKALLVVDRKGDLVHLQLFDPALLSQPEALAFLPCGDLVVASEGRDGPAVLVRYARVADKPAAK